MPKFIKSAYRANDVPNPHWPQVAFIGRSNVGKSTLINELSGMKGLARTSSTPGLTQSLNVYEFEPRYYLIDLPGYGFAHDRRIEGRGFAGLIGSYLSDAVALRLVLLIVDARQGVTEADQNAIEQLTEGELPFVIVLNKIDKLAKSAALASQRAVAAAQPQAIVIAHSNVTGQGLGEIRDAITRAVRTA